MRQDRYILLFISSLLALFTLGCQKAEPKFKVEGSISEATGQTLYLEYLGLGGTELIDSTVIQRSGNYKFEAPLPEYPDFYRLRLGKQVIPFAVDTLPATTTINGDARSFATSYSVDGNQTSSQIREVWLAMLDANVSLAKLSKAPAESRENYNAERDSIMENYKEVALKYIYGNPQSPVAYFALFQLVDGNLVFNLYDKTDSKAFAAIANVYKTYQPENPRTQHLYDLALRSIAVVRQQRREAEQLTGSKDLLDSIEATETSYIDFTLPDRDGNEVTISTLVKEANILLAFTTMGANWSGEFNEGLAKVYDELPKDRLQLVEVGLDTDRHIWISATRNLPWINLQDRDGNYSKLVGLYNLYHLPTLFLITKGGNELHRIENIQEIKTLLR